MIGAGDLDIESAGKDGQSHFDNVRHPDMVQQEIYRQMEATRGARPAGHADAIAAGPAPAAAVPVATPDVAEQISQARDAARPGRDHDRGVRGEEGRAARADVAATVTTPCRVVSLVPSATETLLALGVVAGRVHAVLRAARHPDRRWHQGSRRRRDRRARTRPRRGERRGEPPRGRRRARGRRSHGALDVAARGRPTSAPAVDRARRGGRARRARHDVARAPRAAARGERGRLRVAAAVDDASGPTPTARRCSRTSAGQSFAVARHRYPETDLDAVAALAPDLVVLPSEPYPFRARHARGRAPRCPAARVVLVDGRDLFWWGIRTPAAVARLDVRL